MDVKTILDNYPGVITFRELLELACIYGNYPEFRHLGIDVLNMIKEHNEAWKTK